MQTLSEQAKAQAAEVIRQQAEAACKEALRIQLAAEKECHTPPRVYAHRGHSQR